MVSLLLRPGIDNIITMLKANECVVDSAAFLLLFSASSGVNTSCLTLISGFGFPQQRLNLIPLPHEQIELRLLIVRCPKSV